jgi:hypothetical protein
MKGHTHQKKHIKNKFVKYEFIVANKSDGEFYAKVDSCLGGNRIKVKDVNGREFQIIIPSNFYKGATRENLNFHEPDKNDYWILVQQGISVNQYFLKHIYNNDDKEKLYDRGELSSQINRNNTIEINREVVEEDNKNWIDNI